MLRQHRAELRRKTVAASALIVAVLFLSVVVWAWSQSRAQNRMDDHNCLPAGPIAQTAIIVDATDPLVDVTKKDVRAQLLSFLTDSVKDGEGVQLWHVAGPHGRNEPDTNVICKPAIPQNVMAGNAQIATKRFNNRYVAPLVGAIDAALAAPDEEKSAIMETIQQVRIQTFGTFANHHRGSMQLVIVSDMVQNTIAYSQEDSTFEPFDQFRHSHTYEALSPRDLDGIQVIVFRIARHRHYRDAPSLEAFWRGFILSHHGAFEIRKVMGES